MKKGIFVLGFAILIIIILLPNSLSMSGVGISPSCYEYKDGKCEYVVVDSPRIFEFRVYNYDSKEKTFTMSSNDERIKISPRSFILKQHNKQECQKSPGCQAVNVTIDPKYFEEGNYILEISATTTESSGAINLNEVIISKLYFTALSKRHNSSSLPMNQIIIPDILIPLIIGIIILLILVILIIYDRKRSIVVSEKVENE